MRPHTAPELAEVVRDLYFEESTGCLHVCQPGGEAVWLHFDRGMLYFADSTAGEDRFSSILTAANALPAPTLARLLPAAPDLLRLAGSLVSSGVLTREAISPHVRSVVERGVRRAFSWATGGHLFTPGPATTDFFVPDVLFTFECMLKGISVMGGFAPLKEVLLRLPGRLRMRSKQFLPVNRLALKPFHGFLLSRVDGTMRMDEIALLLPPEEEDESLLFLYGLSLLGIIEMDPPPGQGPFSLCSRLDEMRDFVQEEARAEALIRETAARMTNQTPEEILGVEPHAELAHIQRAYEEGKRLFRRNRFPDRLRAKHKKDLDWIENKLAEAFLKLQVGRLEQAGGPGRIAEPETPEVDTESIQLRREMVKTKAQATKEQNERLALNYHQKAREYYDEKDYHNCIQFCRLAIRFHDSLPGVHALMAQALAHNPNSRWLRMAEEAFQRACELDPWNAEYRVLLGQFYLGQHMSLRARKQFEKALEILPTHPTALQAMKGLGKAGR
jgi:tetratricopeptide (TPR) repeat protein